MVVGWGDGSANTTVSLAAGVLSFTGVSHQYLDNPAGQPTGSFPVTITVTDSVGYSTAASTSIQVNNVPPTPALSGPANGVPGQPRNFTFSATDPSAIDQAAGFTYAVNWGDGSPVQTISRTAATVAGCRWFTRTQLPGPTRCS